MSSNDIQSRAEFFVILAQAQLQVAALREQTPGYPVWGSIEKQLEAMRNWTKDGRTPAAIERASIDIGLLAVRELDPAQDIGRYHFTQALHGLDYYFSHWPQALDRPVIAESWLTRFKRFLS
jgi:hypothetical protein